MCNQCVHIFLQARLQKFCPKLRNPGDHISLSQRLMDSLRKQAVQFVLQNPGATSDNTLARKQTAREKKKRSNKKQVGTYNKTTVHFF